MTTTNKVSQQDVESMLQALWAPVPVREFRSMFKDWTEYRYRKTLEHLLDVGMMVKAKGKYHFTKFKPR